MPGPAAHQRTPVGAVALLGVGTWMLAACWGASTRTAPLPDEGVTVRVSNHSGGPASVAFSFARTPATHLGTVGRLDEGEFTFAWEPGPLEFVVDLPGGLLTSNRLSPRRGEIVYLDISSREARVTREGGVT